MITISAKSYRVAARISFPIVKNPNLVALAHSACKEPTLSLLFSFDGVNTAVGHSFLASLTGVDHGPLSYSKR
jgi:hypothetical protein